MYRPAAYAIDDAIRGPIKKYVPQPGDIYLSTDRSLIINAGHRMAGSGQPNHSGTLLALNPNGADATKQSKRIIADDLAGAL